MKEAFWMIDQLVQQGVNHFCIAPGSRNTPLALAAAQYPDVNIHVHFDERGLGFYTMGLAQGSAAPAAIIATSGTAVGNLLPSVMEAHHSSVPMILLTADRPAELRDCGANQTTDQVKIFQPFVRWQADLPPTLNEGYFRSMMAQACFHAQQNPRGPVQINCQFREPFQLIGPSLPKGSPIQLSFPKLKPDLSALKPWERFTKGLILIGRLDSPESLLPILQLAERLQWPIFADLLTHARCHPTHEQIRHFDWILKSGCELKPDMILHFGERVTSKKTLEWLQELHPCPYLHVDPRPSLLDPARLQTGRIQANASEFCPLFEAKTDPDWLKSWKEWDRQIDGTVESFFAENPRFTEGHAMRIIGEILPSHYPVFLGNGMPIRDADHFLFPKNSCKGFFVNRGLTGIDGNIATAAGLSNGSNAPLLAFIGDQACLHDLNSFALLKKTKYPLTLIVSNNYGSGIFHHLPIVKCPHFEKYWGAAHDWNFEDIARMFELPYVRTDSDPREELSDAFQSGKSSVVEIITSRHYNHQFQMELTERCQQILV